MNATTEKLRVATEIYQQLGGHKFAAMTGSKNFAGDHKSLQMKLSKNKSNAQYCVITLNSLDLYDVDFISITKNFEKRVRAHYENVYSDMLQQIFTRVTGLDTYL